MAPIYRSDNDELRNVPPSIERDFSEETSESSFQASVSSRQDVGDEDARSRRELEVMRRYGFEPLPVPGKESFFSRGWVVLVSWWLFCAIPMAWWETVILGTALRTWDYEVGIRFLRGEFSQLFVPDLDAINFVIVNVALLVLWRYEINKNYDIYWVVYFKKNVKMWEEINRRLDQELAEESKQERRPRGRPERTSDERSVSTESNLDRNRSLSARWKHKSLDKTRTPHANGTVQPNGAGSANATGQEKWKRSKSWREPSVA
ncbi:hypothetical protein GLAREA_06227 [Glarea lozoyensis ATCC 20868]|uniref:Uncharacterized protein n=1 Tax=Glarea lozoyensis (strain ATCC 20868 / MF5171) TaxID=1116229 RepID=S3D647_GLAL2|nr:uncharacterized protein GLAREA_06227 [Glarea lozoyensis ATCC 20868]EPE33215.1 hypothetical protein GLAREA_06227 [Glarea lozoyensis ATCC 20868]